MHVWQGKCIFLEDVSSNSIWVHPSLSFPSFPFPLSLHCQHFLRLHLLPVLLLLIFFSFLMKGSLYIFNCTGTCYSDKTVFKFLTMPFLCLLYAITVYIPWIYTPLHMAMGPYFLKKLKLNEISVHIATEQLAENNEMLMD